MNFAMILGVMLAIVTFNPLWLLLTAAGWALLYID